MSETIKYQLDDDGIVILTIDIADRSMNVLTPEFMTDLDAAIDQVVADDAVKGAIITSAKSSFIAGADLKELVGVFAERLDEKQIYEFAGK
jgi:3-hydroxyacyl-CoA dehydrogenase/enoyl-CoA hydratase/3-hydroxybutyryl-CoA epimerase